MRANVRVYEGKKVKASEKSKERKERRNARHRFRIDNRRVLQRSDD